MPPLKKRTAFSLIELLVVIFVVIFIIGTLLALLLPVTRSAGPAARRSGGTTTTNGSGVVERGVSVECQIRLHRGLYGNSVSTASERYPRPPRLSFLTSLAACHPIRLGPVGGTQYILANRAKAACLRGPVNSNVSWPRSITGPRRLYDEA